MFGLGAGELIVIAVICLVIFGKEDLPKTVRKFAKGMGEFKKVANDAQRSWIEVKDDINRSILVEEQEEARLRALREIHGDDAETDFNHPEPADSAPLGSLAGEPGPAGSETHQTHPLQTAEAALGEERPSHAVDPLPGVVSRDSENPFHRRELTNPIPGEVGHAAPETKAAGERPTEAQTSQRKRAVGSSEEPNDP